MVPQKVISPLRYLPTLLAAATGVIAIAWVATSARTEYHRDLKLGERQTQLLATGLEDTAEQQFGEIASEVTSIRLLVEHYRNAPMPDTGTLRAQVLATLDDDSDILEIFVIADGSVLADVPIVNERPSGFAPTDFTWSGIETPLSLGSVNIGVPVVLPDPPDHGVPLRFDFTSGPSRERVKIIAIVDAALVLNAYESLVLADGSTFAVFRSDGVMLARWPHEHELIGRTFAGPIFSDSIKSAPSATIRAVVDDDGNERIISYRSSDTWPLVLVASVPVRGVLESWFASLPGKSLILLVVLGSIAMLWISLRSSQSALRRSVEELTVGEGRYARLVSNIPGAVYTRRLRADGRFDYPYLSPGFREMFGLGNEPWDGDLTTLLQAVHPDDRQALHESVAASVTGDEVWRKEYRVLKPNGQLSWVRSLARRYHNELNEILWDGIVIDISDIRHHEALLEQVQRTAGLGYWTWEPIIGPATRDLKQRSAHYSDACAAILDLADQDRDLSDADFFARIVHPDDQDRVRRGFERFLASDTLYHDIEYRIVRRDKTIRWLRGTATKEMAAGAVVRIVGVMLDVTDIKAREAQLVQAQKMEAVGELTGGIAHDFNNLLTVVIGNLEALIDGLKADSQEAEIARDALSAADRGATLTKRLLAFSRRQPLSPQPTDLPSLVNELMPLLKRSVGELVQVVVKAEPGLSAAIVDPHQLENAIINLANNARDAMPRGGTLTVELDRTMLPPEGPDADGNDGQMAPFLVMTISDTGIGMAPDVLARAIQPFFTTKPVGQGTGLGLSMVYGLIRQSKGHMRIYSEPGIGTTIKLYLPQAMTDAVASAAPPVAMADFSGRRALLVDDDEQVRATTAAMLRSLGFDVHDAASGKEALAVLESDSAFDIMVTDVILAGGMLGPDVAERARALRPRLHTLFISGFSSDVVGAGSAVLTKPFRRAELARRLAEILRP